MNKLLVALIAGAFALGSTATMAQTQSMSPDDAAKAKADKEAAAKAKVDAAPYDKRSWEKMTPEERKAWRARKQRELTQTEKCGNPNATAKADAISKSAEATKNKPKLDDASRQKALEGQEKNASG